MLIKSGFRAVAPLLAALAVACGGEGGLSSNSAAVTATAGARLELTVSSADWNTLLNQAPPPGGPGGDGAQPGGSQPSGPPSGPPQEALQACTGHAAGDACSFSHAGSDVSGTCRAGPGAAASTSLACAPATPPHGGPPPEAFQACASLSAGAACSVSTPQGTVSGTCRTGPDGTGPLACAPAQPPHDGPPPEALQACASLSAGAACSVATPLGTVSGTCRNGPDGAGTLACAPSGQGPGAGGLGQGPGAGGLGQGPGAGGLGQGPGAGQGPGKEGPGAGGQGPQGVAGSLSVGGAAGVSVHVGRLPAAPGSRADAQPALLIAQDGNPPVVFLPKPTGASAQPLPSGAVEVQLFVNHGEGLTDFGTYVQVPAPTGTGPGGGQGSGSRP